MGVGSINQSINQSILVISSGPKFQSILIFLRLARFQVPRLAYLYTLVGISEAPAKVTCLYLTKNIFVASIIGVFDSVLTVSVLPGSLSQA